MINMISNSRIISKWMRQRRTVGGSAFLLHPAEGGLAVLPFDLVSCLPEDSTVWMGSSSRFCTSGVLHHCLLACPGVPARLLTLGCLLWLPPRAVGPLLAIAIFVDFSAIAKMVIVPFEGLGIFASIFERVLTVGQRRDPKPTHLDC